MPRKLSLYERTKLLSIRAEQIANGATTTLPSTVDIPTSAIDIAQMEFDAGLIPLIIRRTFPNGRTVLVEQTN